MTKKGQLTFFVFLGFLILFSLWFLAGQAPVIFHEQDPLAQAVTAFVQGCHDQAAKQAVFYLGLVGGRPMQWPSYIEYDDYYKIPYYYQEGRNLLAQRSIAIALETSMEYLLPRCTGTFSSFPATIRAGQPKATVLLTPDEVIVTTTYPLKLPTQELQTDYISHVTIPVQKYVEAAHAIISFTQQDESLIPWKILSSMHAQGINPTAYVEKDKTLIYRFVDTKQLFNEPYIFQFAVKLS